MQYRKVEDGFFICLARDDKIIESLTQIVKEQQIGSGTIVGIGAVKDARLGFYHLNRKSYDEKRFPEEMELVNLSGNVSWLDDKPVIHCHVTLGNTRFEAIAGHLFEAEIAVTGEFFLSVKPTRVVRKRVEAMGLNLIHLE